MPSADWDRRIHWILRIGACLCFLGHGAFGLIGKQAWIAYFGVVGISVDHAWSLEPMVGSVDILLAAMVLVRPRPIILAYMTIWAVWTALLRPLSGESAWEAVERAGNYGVPFALLLAAGRSQGAAWWFRGMKPAPLDAISARHLRAALVAATTLLLAGHGMLSVLGKPGLVLHYDLLAAGRGRDLALAAGMCELAMASALVLRPTPALALLIAVWKLGSESLFVVAGSPVWEVVERAGSYAAPLALALLINAAARAGGRETPAAVSSLPAGQVRISKGG